MNCEMDDVTAQDALKNLSYYLHHYWRKRTILLLDEYDTPMQEAYVHGYWNEFINFIRGLFNSALKTNPYLERAVMTGITRVSKESVFSDLNNDHFRRVCGLFWFYGRGGICSSETDWAGG